MFEIQDKCLYVFKFFENTKTFWCDISIYGPLKIKNWPCKSLLLIFNIIQGPTEISSPKTF